jgi:hypothetical protein
MCWRGESWEEMRREQKHKNLQLITAFVILYLGNLNLTTDENLLTPYVYVAYRSQDPDEATVGDVLRDLKEHHIDVSQLVEYSTDHCQ